MKKLLRPIAVVALIPLLAMFLAVPALADGIWPSSTYLTMTASATEVTAGETVDLTITEVNDGAVESPWSDLSPVWVEVEVNGAPYMTLDQTSGSFVGTDIDADGIMVPGEIWEWDISVVINVNTTIVAIGHGIDEGGWDKTPPKDPDEIAEVSITVTNGGESSTYLTMDASATQVHVGDDFTLTIHEVNDGDFDLTPAWVVLSVGGTLTTLDDTSPGFASSIDLDAILEPTETWEWTVTLQTDVDVLITATGHGMPPSGPDVTPPEDPDEYAEVRITVVNGGGEGFTPGFWKNHLDYWPATGYAPGDNYDTVFGVYNTIDPNLTLEEAINTGGGKEKALLRHATAALLNAAHPDVDYEYLEAEIISMVQDAYSSGDFNGIKDLFEVQNELGGDI